MTKDTEHFIAWFFFYLQIVQQLVDERLRALQATIFDKHFKELKDRVDKIECAAKHQTAINTLQVSRWKLNNVFFNMFFKKYFNMSKSTSLCLSLSFVQAKIARLAKKFGEANQASENKKKHEVRHCFHFVGW